MKYIIFLFNFFLLAELQAQLAAGPMLGHTGMTNTSIWIQTQSEEELELILDSPSLPGYSLSMIAKAEAPEFTAHFNVEGLKPGRSYNYRIASKANDWSTEKFDFKTQVLWQYRSDPPEINIALGSCTYINEEEFDRPGKPYGGDYQIFESIAAMNPDLMLWLGDNTYLREPDMFSYEGMVHRYSHTRQNAEMQRLLRACPNYAIWDDHDYGPNDSNRSFIYKDWSLEVFKEFWANPTYGLEENGGITSSFKYADLEFFMLDNRFFRTDANIKTMSPEILGESQQDWLIEALQCSKAKFKFVLVGGQFLSDCKVYENHAQYAEERTKLINRMIAENIAGVIFLSGDRHSTSLSKLNISEGKSIFDLTVSPLTSTTYDHSKEENTLRVEGSAISERNFGLIHVSGKEKERTIEIKIYSADAALLWEYKIAESELY